MYILEYLIIIFVFWQGYRRLRDRTMAKSPPPRKTYARASGDAGEARVLTELQSVLPWLCGDDYYVHPSPVLLHHAPGTAFPTAEVDHLAITPFGIFVIETKHWSGRIERGADANTVRCHLPDGKVDERRSPLAQNRAKVAFLRAMLPAVWDVHGVGVFANGACTVAPSLPLSLIRVNDLAHWLRTKKEEHERAHKPAISVQQARAAIRKLSIDDPNGIELRKHQLRVSQQSRG
ncbi:MULTISPECIES: nuclease-related domain-containing protein [Burkholderia]|uniref:nuclease-related domain-containing protein n=1 Tax=Burkholderia TaxID=32008 RepID=UPI001FB92D94|nr:MULTISPECIES: nuclease-related domain-containing protein [Burkholderia]